MSRKGSCLDKTGVESFSATLKNEEVAATYEAKAKVRKAIANYIHGSYKLTQLHF